MERAAVRRAVVCAVGVGVAGCQPSPSDQVAMGVARLTVRNLGAVATLVNKDATCGFESPTVKRAATLSGNIGSAGTITWSVTDCEIDAGGGLEVSRDCNGVTVTARGKVKVSATKSIGGTLTGNAESPAIPANPDAATITITRASLTGFRVENSSSTDVLTIVSGALSGIVKPRLAASVGKSGACAFSTPNTHFLDVTYDKADLEVDTESSHVVAHASTSRLEAQNGVRDDKENWLSGTLTLSSRIGPPGPSLPGPPLPPAAEKPIPTPGDTDTLDPAYTSDVFKASYGCEADLVTPESYVCADLTDKLADGAARLTMKAFATAAALTDVENTCGFSTPSVMQGATRQGVDGAEGTVTLTITDCTIYLPAATSLATDCADVTIKAGGSFVVSGTKVYSGRLAPSPEDPVIPTSDSPTRMHLRLTPAEFKVTSTADANGLILRSGTLEGTLTSRYAMSSETDQCTIKTPTTRFEGLTHTDTVVGVISDKGTIDLAITSSSLDAVNGAWGSQTNTVSGTLVTGGRTLQVPVDGQGLDPDYDAAAFDAGWQCAEGLQTPVSYACQ